MRDALNVLVSVALLTLVSYIAVGVTRMEARTGPLTEPVTIEGGLSVDPDYITSWQTEVPLPRPPGGTAKVQWTVQTTCGVGGAPGTEPECLNHHEAKVARAMANHPPCE